MGLLDRIKNLFTDEEEIIEEDDIVEEVVEKKRKLPTFMREKIEKEEKVNIEKKELKRETKEPIAPPEPLVEINNKEETPQFKFPFVFDENDFEVPKVEEVKIEKPKEEPKQTNLYNATKKEKQKETKKFRPTPIISPVYGVLDKNYKKEEVKSKPEHTKKLTRASSKKTDFETVRMKAYGTLSDEINENLLHEIEEDNNVEVIDPNNLLYEITTDKDTTIANAEENYYDFGVSYELPKREVKVPDKEVKIVNHNDDDEIKADKIEVKEPKKKKLETTVVEDAGNETDLELTEDLFSLIDSMYDERNDE